MNVESVEGKQPMQTLLLEHVWSSSEDIMEDDPEDHVTESVRQKRLDILLSKQTRLSIVSMKPCKSL